MKGYKTEGDWANDDEGDAVLGDEADWLLGPRKLQLPLVAKSCCDCGSCWGDGSWAPNRECGTAGNGDRVMSDEHWFTIPFE